MDAFAAMKQVRDAFSILHANAHDPNALSVFSAIYAQHRYTFVPAFDVAGITYPRTDGHKLSEEQARYALDTLLYPAMGKAYAIDKIKYSVIEAAFPVQEEVLRQEIEKSVSVARQILELEVDSKWVNTAWPPQGIEIRQLLRMPTQTGTYDELTKLRGAKYPMDRNPYRGYQADHLIVDEAYREVGVSRRASKTDNETFTTYLLDGPNEGAQHRFVTNAQNMAKKKYIESGENPTVQEYLTDALEWMTDIYTRSELGVDVSVTDKFLKRGAETPFYVKGYAISQAGFMKWEERKVVGRAIALLLVIEALDFNERHQWPRTRKLNFLPDPCTNVTPARANPPKVKP